MPRVLYPAACDVDEDLLKLVTMVIVSLNGERDYKLRPYDRARCTLVYLRKHDTLEQLAAGFRIGVAAAWRYVNNTIELLGQYAPSLAEALTSHHADGYLLLDGTVAETDRVQAEGHYSGKVHREGVNLQVITAEEGRLLWLSPALPGGTNDVKAAREHDIVATCADLDLEVLADKGYIGAGGTVITPVKRRQKTKLSDKHKATNKVHAALRAPVERTIARARTSSRQSPQPSSPSWSTREKGSKDRLHQPINAIREGRSGRERSAGPRRSFRAPLPRTLHPGPSPEIMGKYLAAIPAAQLRAGIDDGGEAAADIPGTYVRSGCPFHG